MKKVKASVKRKGYPRQKDLAEDLKISLATVNNFLNCKPVDHLNFEEICEKLGYIWQEIADLDLSDSEDTEISGVVEDSTVLEDESPTLYIKREPIETVCYQSLKNPGALIRVKAPHWMGKTTLIQQTLNRLRLDNYRTVNLSLHLAERKDFADLDYFLRWVCIWVGQSLGLENCLEQYWNLEFSTSKMNCTNYFEKYLLAQADTPLVLCLDDLDRIFEYEEVAAEFLGLLRAWYEQGRNRPIWKRLRLVLSHSTEVYIPLNIYESPFNVGKSIELSEFCFDQIEILAQSHNINGENLQKLHGLVGGHPHLIDQAFTQFKLQSHISLEQLLADAASEGGIYSGHLQHLWRVIHRHEHLITALRQVINSDQPVQLEPEDARQLYYLGLVTYQSNTVVIRCHLYHQYFCRKLQQ